MKSWIASLDQRKLCPPKPNLQLENPLQKLSPKLNHAEWCLALLLQWRSRVGRSKSTVCGPNLISWSLRKSFLPNTQIPRFFWRYLLASWSSTSCWYGWTAWKCSHNCSRPIKLLFPHFSLESVTRSVTRWCYLLRWRSCPMERRTRPCCNCWRRQTPLRRVGLWGTAHRPSSSLPLGICSARVFGPVWLV